MKYFLTGATGFIGGTLARQLVAQGHEVRALVRDLDRARSLQELGVQLVPGDLRYKDSMREAMRGTDGVFHVGAWYKVGTRDTTPAETVNVQGTRNVLELMQELEIPRGVYTSTVAVFSDTGGKMVDENYRYSGPMLNVYEQSKWRAHYEIAEPMMQAGLPLTIVMPGAVYGPGDQSPVRQAMVMWLQGKMPFMPTGTAFCWAHVEDTATGHRLAMDKGTPGESYIIAGPRYSMEEVFHVAERLSGIKAPRIRIAPGMIRGAAKFVAAVEKFIPVPETYAAESLRSSAGVTYTASNAKARRELGFEPRDLDLGLPETLAHEMRLLGLPLPARLAS